MITYELSLELKNAGFPQNPNGSCYSCFEPRGEMCDLPESEHLEKCRDYDCRRCDTPDVYPPTLSELIEFCGNKFHGMYKADDCIAHGFNSDDEFDDVYVHGQSFEIAVAKLWLELNKK